MRLIRLLICLWALTHAFSLSADPAYAGTQQCKTCHQEAYDSWSGSHHDMAMGHASPETVVGDFNDAELTVYGVKSRFYTRDGGYFVHTEAADGSLQEFEVLYTFGIEPLQQYLIEFDDGRLQALSLAWDARPDSEGGQRWYHLYPDEKISFDDELHWTGPQQNWNYMCADCHSTNVRKNYDAEKRTFATTWSEINVGCEACHGPGETHVNWANQDRELQASDSKKGLVAVFHDRKGVSWPINTDTGIGQRTGPEAIGRSEINMCAACHSRRGLIKEGRETDPKFLQHHTPALLAENLYFDDGQILEEVYVWGSYAQSKMHERGVTCSDCHDPHSMQLKAEQSNVCAQCHLPSKFAVTSHHGHPSESTGADCLSCHMPERTYMGVDPRRDHSLRVPRPDLSLEFETPNACNQCHTDQTVEWAAQAFSKMFPDAAKPWQHWTTAIAQARAGKPQAEVSLLTAYGKPDTPDIARATLIAELQNFLSPLSGQVIEQSLRDDSALVRMAALRTLDVLPPANRFGLAGHLLDDEVRAVRVEAARVLAASPMNQLSAPQRQSLQQAMRDFFETQELNADRPESRMNLGNLSAEVGSAQQAERYYRQALKLNERYSPAYLNLSELYRQQGMQNESVQLLRTGLEKQPGDAGLHHALGLAYIRSGNNSGAVEQLRQAHELAPDVARYSYVLGVALNSTGQADEAVSLLSAAVQQHPNDREIMFAIATIERDRGNTTEATDWARRLIALNPADQQAESLLNQLLGTP